MKPIAAAFIFFTRLPLWHWIKIPKDDYKKIVAYWPVTGWLTASCTAGTLWGMSLITPYPVAILCAISTRLWLTGALHEDGLADFFDGFGGGRKDREQILSIMKDSHIGTYGVTALILYFILYYTLLSQLPLPLAITAVLAADPFGKWTASRIIHTLPYARSEAESKSGIVYNRMSPGQFITGTLFGILPVMLLFPPLYWVAGILPLIVFATMSRLIKKRLGGYTGDCCGALFLLCETAFLLAIHIIYHSYGTFFCPSYLG